MLHTVPVPFVDTRAAALSWWLGDDAPAPLASLALEGASGRLELHLLGASHHAVAHVDTAAGAARCPEVVACGARTPSLPARHEGAVGPARYRFRSTTTTYDAAGLARVARDLRRRHAATPGSLVGVFPGSPDALTVLSGREVRGGWTWASWHVYPGPGEVVRTQSSLVVDATLAGPALTGPALTGPALTGPAHADPAGLTA